MAGRLISGMQLDAPLSHILHARGILTAKDVLCKPETELMELLDLPLSRIRDVIFQTSIDACPPYRSALALKEERESEEGFGHLPTHLMDIDSALLGGIPFGAITEVVGPAGFGKTQLCLMLCVNAALQKEYGGLDGSVIYYDSEHKFHPGRMAEIAQSRFPHVFSDLNNLRKLATSILVYHPHSLDEFISSLDGLENILIEKKVRLLIVDSIAALLQRWTRKPISEAWASSSDNEVNVAKSNLINVRAHEFGCSSMGWLTSSERYLAEAFRIPILVTNQVRISSNSRFSVSRHNEDADTMVHDPELQLTAALGPSWAHSVNIRIILESIGGQRFLKIAKSPLSPVTVHPYKVTNRGLELIGRDNYTCGGDIMQIHIDGKLLKA
ncbi:hypothetical protein KP509_20G048900 [Ceratopteris richardii]|uniref:RecA family profile 1 domain-containing protein n=1 Tax=Ceratopteris richardii TaxID=49495 RepID=A0A8T2SFU4_CERRI|nr:hypothetical protein KP509_20G048900 [Ceratopteris richardii]